MDPIYKFPASPGTPLFPVSPERANRQYSTQDSSHPLRPLPQSPSLPSLPQYLSDGNGIHTRGSSDVQGKVAQFNGLAKEAAQRRKDNEAALKRAILGREEAEAESRRLREGNEELRSENEEGRARERRVGGRLEALREELQGTKEKQAHERTIFEKEVRRARKEAFKSSSSLVSLQDELKNARNRYTLMREEMESQRRKSDEKEQEAFQFQCQLAGLKEELDDLRKVLRVTEEEREGLKMVLKGDEVLKAASEGAIALPISGDEDEFTSPRKRRREERQSLKENVDPLATNDEDAELMALKEDLRLEKRLRTKAEEEMHFLKMECQFGVCSCRIAEREGTYYVHDGKFLVQDQAAEGTEATDTKHADLNPDEILIDVAVETSPPKAENAEPQISDPAGITFSPNSGTFSKSPARPSFANQEELVPTSLQITPPAQSTPIATPPPFQPSIDETLPQTPRPLPQPPMRQPRTISTTTITTIPLKPEEAVFSPPAPNTPGGISREQALEQIRLRRGRARSFAVGLGGTPGKGVGVDGGRREISAPAGKGC